MRYLTALCRSAAVAAITAAVFTPALADANLVLDGRKMDASPVIINERTYLPLRAVFEALGAYVEWDGQARTVYAQKRLYDISMTVGADVCRVNGEVLAIDAPVIIDGDGRTMVPVRAAGDALGCEVEWDADSRTVILTSPASEHDFLDVYMDFWGENSDGEIVLTGRAAYPEIDDETGDGVIEAFNDYLAAETEQMCDSVLLNKLDDAEKSGVSYMFERRFDIVCDSGGIVSVLNYDSLFDGRAYPQITVSAVSFDLNNGRILSVKDATGEEFSALKGRVVDMVAQKINAAPQEFYTDALSRISDAVTESGWYIANDGVHFFVDPGTIAPPEQGICEVVIAK